jgi:multimeric flavodoxin WrbA
MGGGMARILIVYHSQTGNTKRMAEAVAEGAAGIEGTEVILRCARETVTEDLVLADGIAFGTPENFGTMSGMLKDLFDRTFYPTQDKVFRKPYVVFVSAGNDGSGALNAVERIALGYKFRKIYDPVIVQGKMTAEALEKCRELGAILAAGCGLGIY